VHDGVLSGDIMYDRQIQQLGQTEDPETQALLKVFGVGHITALTYVLTLGSKQRFQRSRDVGCYLGLRPRRSQSGDRDPQLGITKAGNSRACSPRFHRRGIPPSPPYIVEYGT
jgi:transposase